MEDLPPEPSNIRFLRRLVTVLTTCMILGVCAIFVLLFIRLSAETPAQTTLTTLPAQIVLPEGTQATAFTTGPGWYAIVTDDNRILIFDAANGDLRQSIDILSE